MYVCITVASGEDGTKRLASMGDELGMTNSHSQAMLWNRGATADASSSQELCSSNSFQTCILQTHILYTTVYIKEKHW